MVKLSLIAILSLLVLVFFGQAGAAQDSIQNSSTVIKVTLLGTGTPQPLMNRFGPSILVQAGSEILLFDTGRGCLQRLKQLNILYDKLDAVFLTHLHSDHIVGLPDLWLTGWLVSERIVPLNIYGPVGTADMIKYLRLAFAYDLKIRSDDDKVLQEGSTLQVTEIQQGTIYDKNDVKVIAFDVDHFPIKPAFGYRIEYKGHSVVLSGDTRYSENLIKFAQRTDLLVHEVIIAPDTLSKSDPKYHILAHHTTAEQAGRVFSAVKPKLAVFSHISKLYGLTEEDIMKSTKANYSGPLVMGEDLMSFSIGETVTTTSWKPKTGNGNR
jgi:ribonuclease Z